MFYLVLYYQQLSKRGCVLFLLRYYLSTDNLKANHWLLK